MTSLTVAILGGGDAGMSAARELVEHGFRVRVYDASSDLCGKARSAMNWRNAPTRCGADATKGPEDGRAALVCVAQTPIGVVVDCHSE